jgi:hypothetical protein
MVEQRKNMKADNFSSKLIPKKKASQATQNMQSFEIPTFLPLIFVHKLGQ